MSVRTIPVEFVLEPPNAVGNPLPEKDSTSERRPLLQAVERVQPIVGSPDAADEVAALKGLEVSWYLYPATVLYRVSTFIP